MQGATIKTDERTGKIVIARVMHGGAADRSGLIHSGDEVIEVNGIDVIGKTPNDVLEILVLPVFARVLIFVSSSSMVDEHSNSVFDVRGTEACKSEDLVVLFCRTTWHHRLFSTAKRRRNDHFQIDPERERTTEPGEPRARPGPFRLHCRARSIHRKHFCLFLSSLLYWHPSSRAILIDFLALRQPCKEAGLDFRKGDIIHIVSQDDPYWYASAPASPTRHFSLNHVFFFLFNTRLTGGKQEKRPTSRCAPGSSRAGCCRRSASPTSAPTLPTTTPISQVLLC